MIARLPGGWWTALLAGVSAVLAAFLLLTDGVTPQARTVGVITLAAHLLVWVVLGRHTLRPVRRPHRAAGVGGAARTDGRTDGHTDEADHGAGPLAVLYLAALLATLLVLCAVHPTTALLQAFAYPYAWSWSRRLEQVVAANVGIAVAVAAGFLVNLGTGSDGWLAAIGSAGISLAFSFSMGAWITSIVRAAEKEGRLQAQLDAAQLELAAAHREAGIAAERERFSRELHDTLTQTLTVVVMLTERAGTESATDPRAAARTIALAEGTARQALTETRALVAGGRGPGVGGEGIVPRIDRLCARFTAETDTPVGTRFVGPAETLTRDEEVVLLRCAQEALANVRKHARASRVDLALTVDPAESRLVVTDDGVGFDPTADRTGSRGYGLPGMTTRLALAGGSLGVDSAPAEGTRLTVRLPRHAAPAEGTGRSTAGAVPTAEGARA